MTALVFRPDPLSASNPLLGSYGRRGEFDRRLLIGSVTFALFFHLAVLLIPLPARHSDPPQMPPDHEPTRIFPTEIPPPERREPPEPIREPIDYRLPVPFPVAPDVEPVVEDSWPDDSSMLLPLLDLELDPEPPADPRVYDEGTKGLVLPVPLPDRAQPEYPRPAREARVQGRVVLTAVISEAGDVVSLEVLHTTRPDLGFSEAAVAAVSQWRYEPGRYRGRPVPVRLRVLIEFTLR